MMILSSQEMYEVDRKTVRGYRIPALVLMENAGMQVAQYIIEKYPDKRHILVFAGPGNNGGDGLVAARHLFLSGYDVSVLFVGSRKKRTRNNKRNFLLCRNLKIPMLFIRDKKQLKKHEELLSQCEIVLDAMLGLGLNTPLKGTLSEIVDHLNELTDKIKISIDIPTGLSADDFSSPGNAFRADVTITFGALKISHVFSPARTYCGRVVCRDIGFPEELFHSSKFKVHLIKPDPVKTFLPRRIAHFHKNDFGHVAVFAGSVGKAGAAVLSSEAVLRSGAGLVTTICQAEINPIIQTRFIEGMTCPVDLKDPERAFEQSRDLLNKADVILAGCGIGTGTRTQNFLHRVLSMENKTFVLDADALNILAEDLDLLKRKTNQYILTPHIGEFSRLIQKNKQEIQKDLFSISREFCQKYDLILVLKSSETIVVNSQGDIYVNAAANDGMATAGSGDVLAGIIAGISAQNNKQERSLFHSVVAGVYLHSLSGELAREKIGSPSMTATDLLACLSGAFQRILK